MPRETKVERARRIAKATDELVAKLTPSGGEMLKDMREQIARVVIPFDGGRAIGDLTRSEAAEYSQRLVALAHCINLAIPGLPEARTLRRKTDVHALRGQHTQHSAHAGFIDDDEDRNPAGVARRR